MTAVAALVGTSAETSIAAGLDGSNAAVAGTDGSSAFVGTDGTPDLEIIPIAGGLWREVDDDESDTTTVLGYRNTDQLLDNAAMFFTGSSVAVLSVFLMGFLAMSFFTKAKGSLDNTRGNPDKSAKPSQEFVPFVRRGDPVSPLNPLRFGGEELPEKPADTSASSRIYGRRGIQ